MGGNAESMGMGKLHGDDEAVKGIVYGLISHASTREAGKGDQCVKGIRAADQFRISVCVLRAV